MIFDLLAPSQGPRGQGPKMCAGACAIHVSNSHTKLLVEFWRKIKFLTTQPPVPPQAPTPGAWPRWRNENPVWYVYILYLSFVRRHTKFGLKIFEIDLVIEI